MTDFIVALALVLAIWKGLQKGLVMSLLSIAGYGLGIFLALRFRTAVAGWMSDSVSAGAKWLPVLAFFLIMAGVMLGIYFLGNVLEGVLQMAMLGWANKVAGILFYTMLYLFLISIALRVVELAGLLSPEAKAASFSYPILSHIISSITPFLSELF